MVYTTGGRACRDFEAFHHTGAQQWQAQADGSLVNPRSGKCLDDTGWSTTPGTQAEIWACAGSPNQHWILP